MLPSEISLQPLPPKTLFLKCNVDGDSYTCRCDHFFRFENLRPLPDSHAVRTLA
jgi:hypothetical protein